MDKSTETAENMDGSGEGDGDTTNGDTVTEIVGTIAPSLLAQALRTKIRSFLGNSV
jgi:hypothetical protein